MASPNDSYYTTPKRVVIVGGGFGGLSAAKKLCDINVEITLIDRSNHYLFQPLLYQVATAALSPTDIATATRSILGTKKNVTIIMDEVIGVDTQRRTVNAANSGPFPYDYLILATGADYSFFGNDKWAEFSPVLKTLSDALNIRERLLSAFEEAERSTDRSDIQRLLTFVVVGGGPTGVEMAGAISELTRSILKKSFSWVSDTPIRVVLVEASDTILSAFPKKQSRYAQKALENLGVEVKLNTQVKDINESGVLAGEELISSANVIWCAGTEARPAASWVDAESAKNKSIKVMPDCTIPNHPNIFAIGDVACHVGENGKPLPGLAPVAKQQGRYVAQVITASINGATLPGPFQYRNWGSLAVIGRARAAADFGWLRVQGFTAWLTWSLVHLMLLIDFRSRLTVYVNWAWAWCTHDRGARLLTKNIQTLKSKLQYKS